MKITLDLSPDDIKFLSQMLSRENNQKLGEFRDDKVDYVRYYIECGILKSLGFDLQNSFSYCSIESIKELKILEKDLGYKILAELGWKESDITISR